MESSRPASYYLSNLLARNVLSGVGSSVLGKVRDLVIDLDAGLPQVVTLIYRRLWSTELWCLPWHDVGRVDESGIILKPAPRFPVLLSEQPLSASQVRLKEFLLDKQIVDVHGAKVERVNDLQFVASNGKLVLATVDVGLRGILRRLGFETAVVRFCEWFFDYHLKERFISWHFVQPLADLDRLRLQIPLTQISKLHPADLADIIEDMDVHERAAMVDALNEEILADALEEMDPKVQVAIMRALKPDKAADIIEEMAPDEAADLIADLPSETVDGIFREMDDDYEEKVKGLLAHDEDEAGGLMSTQYLTVTPDTPIIDALAHIRRNAEEVDVIYYIYVVDSEGRLLGVVNLRELLSHEIFTPVERIMTTRMITASLDDKAKDLADLFAKYGFRGLPVVNDEGKIEGVIRFKALLEILAPYLGK